MIDVRKEIPQSGKMLTAVIVLAVVLGVVWLVSNTITAAGVKGVVLLVAVIAAAGVAGKTLSDWRSGVYLFLGWLLFEDLVRKYMGNSMYVYFGKDALIAATYLGLVLSRLRGDDTERFRAPFKYSLGLFVLLGLAQVFNPSSPSLWYGVLGLKLYFYYIPLMFVGYALLRSELDLHRLLVVSMGLAGVIALVGIIQAIAGLDFLNPHGGADIDELGHMVRYTPSGVAVPRPPSVFVSDGRFAIYLTVVFILGMGTAGYLLLRRTQSGRRIVFPALGLVGVATTLCGARGAFVWVGASALLIPVGMLWGAPPRLGEGYRLVKAIRRSFIFVALAMSLAVVIFPQVVGSRLTFYRETLALDSPDSEAARRGWSYPLTNLLMAFTDGYWPVGHGIGTASLGVQYVSRIMEKPAVSFAVENGYGDLIVEFGILGPLLWLVWASSLVFHAFKTVIRLKGTWAFPVAFSILWFAFLVLFPFTWATLNTFENFVVNAYFWLLVGVLFRLPALVDQVSAPSNITSD